MGVLIPHSEWEAHLVQSLPNYFGLVLLIVIVYVEVSNKIVFVRNIAWTTTEDGLKEVFAGCKNVRLPKKPDGRSRG